MIDPNEPRSGGIILAGLPWLARMIDKARLSASGEIEAYDLEYPCPRDQGLLSQLGIEAETFQQIACQSKTDTEILEKLQAHGIRFITF